jgi:hypothetical protein
MVFAMGLVFNSHPLEARDTLPKSPAGLTATMHATLPARTLRGYGRVEAEFVEYSAADKSPASILRIACTDGSHAALTLGKYLSDLRCLGGVSESHVTAGARQLPALRIEEQGSVAAWRDGPAVIIVATEQDRDLTSLLAALPLGESNELDFHGSPVPMFLDRYDRYGWHFYFNPWSTPKGQPDYDLNANFRRWSDLRRTMHLGSTSTWASGACRDFLKRAAACFASRWRVPPAAKTPHPVKPNTLSGEHSCTARQ